MKRRLITPIHPRLAVMWLASYQRPAVKAMQARAARTNWAGTRGLCCRSSFTQNN